MARTFPANESNSHALPRAALPPRPAPRALRPAFTLVELLVVITILAILASMMLFALAGAQENAKQARTQGTIAKLNTLIMQKYESYRTRRVPVDVTTLSASLGYTASLGNVKGPAKARLNALRELMSLEMPDDFRQIEDATSTQNPKPPVTPKFLGSLPALSRKYYTALKNARQQHSNWDSMKHEQTAECLYMIVTRGLDDPDVLEQFSSGEIGDTDGDGLPEFIDGWGHPIKFLRWAPRFSSPLQSWDESASPATPPAGRDPFDPLGVDPNNSTSFHTFPLFPLIYSGGPDAALEFSGTFQDKGYDIGEQPKGGVDYKAIDYDPFDISVRNNIGAKTDTNNDGSIDTTDNITNHDIETH
jgi:prepilin-type N-terminal cleavage/methylation domain-containing protein